MAKWPWQETDGSSPRQGIGGDGRTHGQSRNSKYEHLERKHGVPERRKCTVEKWHRAETRDLSGIESANRSTEHRKKE
jgi:hypothetical protein